MRRMIRRLPVVLGAALLLAQAPVPSPIPTLPSLTPLVASRGDAKQAATLDPIGFGWSLFFYANWPALTTPGSRGVPDPSKPFGTTGGPVVWETWKNAAEVYLPNGAAPAAWNVAAPLPPDVARATVPPADSGDYWQQMTDDVQVDGFDVLDTNDQEILYEILMSSDMFSYVTTNTLYNVQGQMAFASAKGALDFPWDSLEVKAAWRWIDPNDTRCPAGNYFTTRAYYQARDNNGVPIGYRTGLMGLTGLHIISKAVPGWVWITFEQVDNETCTKAKRLTPIDPAVAEVNATMQQALAGTKWAHYEMVGVQTTPGTAAEPTVLANTQIESAFQTRSSCSTCHGIASIAPKKPADPTVPIRMSFVDAQASPPYFIGPPPSLGAYRSQDFVWSLRKAFWTPATTAATKKTTTTTKKPK